MIGLLHGRAAGVARCRILGVRLVPLLVGHLRHLEDEGCEPVRTPAELGTAILICSMPPRKWKRWRNSRWALVKVALWSRLIGKWDFAEKLSLWCDYVRWHTEMPVFIGKGEGRRSELPSYRLMRVRLMRLGYHPHEIDLLPYQDALWDLLAASEIDGAGEVKPYTQAEMDEQAASIDWEKVKRDAVEGLAKAL